MIRLLLTLGQVLGEDTMLEQPVRRRIWDIIRNRPGIHASQLCRESGEAWGTVQYLLGLLRKVDLVTSVEAGRERRFFPPGVDEEHARLMSLLEQGRREEIARFILSNPGQRQVDVCGGVNVSRKTFRASVQPLVEAGLIHERKGLQTNRYFPEPGLEPLLQAERFDVSVA